MNPQGVELRELREAARLTQEQALALLPEDERISHDTLSRYERGDRLAAREASSSALERLRAMLRARVAGEVPAPAKLGKQGALYLTALAEEALNYIDYAWRARRDHIWLLSAPWGHGKSFVAEHWAARVRRYPCFYIESAERCSAAELIARLHEHFSLPPLPTGYRKREAIIAHLRRHAALLLIDQAEELTILALNALQHIWDRSKADGAEGCAVVLLASPALEARMLVGRSGHNLQRLRTRISRVHLTPVKPEEVMAIVNDIIGKRDWKPGAFARFHESTGFGCLRQVVAGAHAINQVLSASGKNGHDPVTAKLLEVALRHLL